MDSNNYTLDEIIEIIRTDEERQKPVDFIQFCQSWITTTTIKGKNNYKSALNAFIAYLGTEHFDASKITASVLNGFMDYLMKRSTEKARALTIQGKRVPTNRTVSLYLGGIRHLFYEAKKRYNDYDRNIIRITNSPFEYVTIPKQKATRKRAIQPQLIKSIWEMPYLNARRGAKRTCLSSILPKIVSSLSFCLMGINSVDLYNATELDGNRLIYYRAKTKDRRLDKAKMEVIIPKIVLPIIEKYRDRTGKRLFNFYQYYCDYKGFNKALNKGLKEIGKLLNIDDLEFYAARHSWATIALNKCKVDKYTVHAALNHVDESMRVTDIYIERDFVNENKANAKVIKYVFGK